MASPPRPHVTLAPTGYGLAYLASSMALLAVAVLYNNNLCFVLAFSVLSVMAVTAPAILFHIRGVRVLGARCEPVFAGGRAAYALTVRLERGRGADIGLTLGDGHAVRAVARGRAARLEVRIAAPRRGWLTPGPATITTGYPLGLFRAGFRVQVPPCLVYPRPLGGAGTARLARDGGQRLRPGASGAEDFRDLTPWRPGDPPARIAWKASVRGQGLQTKVFDALVGQAPVFDWYALEGGTEQRLSRLCHMVLEASRAGQAFGLRLPGAELAVARGRGHRRRALAALALHGEPGGGHG
jgi:uncharacterized protein (DUF58 family)